MAEKPFSLGIKKDLKFQVDLTPNTKGTIQMFSVVNAMVAKNTNHNYPAPISIVSSVYEGCLLPIDKGLEIEAKYFVLLMDRFPEYDQESF